MLWGWLDDLRRDVLLAARSLGRTAGFTAAAVASLALGFALSVSTLAVVNAYLIRSFPFPDADRLYHVQYVPAGQAEPRGVSAVDWSELDDLVDFVDRSGMGRLYVRESGTVDERWGFRVSPGVLEALGARPSIGRSFEDGDFDPGAERVVLVGHDWWRSRFGEDQSVIGRIVQATEDDQTGTAEAYRVIGVLPPGFRYAREYARNVEFAVPYRSNERPYMLRLRPGVAVTQAEARITDAVRRVATTLPGDWRGVRLEGVQARYLSGVRPMLVAMLAASALVLVIACLNLCVLGLLRAMRRQREMAVRLALGAGRRHLARTLMLEAGLLSAAGIALGFALSAAALGAIAPGIETYIGRPVPGGTGAMVIDGTVVTIAAVAGLLVAFALSAVPAMVPWSRPLRDALSREGRAGLDHPASNRLRSALVITEIAGTVALLAGGGLMIESVRHLLRTDLGFAIDGVGRARITVPARTYPDAPALSGFYERLLARIGPDARVALANLPPFFEPPVQRLEIGDSDAGRSARVLTVGPGYFELLRIPLVEGRGFTPADRVGAEPVAIVGQSLARTLWPDGSAVGRRLRTADQSPAGSPITSWRMVVGVARDVTQTYEDTDRNDVYLPFLQAPAQYATLYVDRSPGPGQMMMLSSAVSAIDPAALLIESPSLRQDSDLRLARPRFLTTLLSAFAGLATLLALVGLYGVTAYTVQQREREIAVRLALGSTPGAVTAMFLKRGSVVVGLGIALGLGGAVAMTRLLSHELHGIEGLDAMTLATVCALMTGTSLAAIWWPSSRASSRAPAARLNES